MIRPNRKNGRDRFAPSLAGLHRSGLCPDQKSVPYCLVGGDLRLTFNGGGYGVRWLKEPFDMDDYDLRSGDLVARIIAGERQREPIGCPPLKPGKIVRVYRDPGVAYLPGADWAGGIGSW
jgi:hypothetical protein